MHKNTSKKISRRNIEKINKNKVCVMLPAFNEAKVIGSVIRSIRKRGYKTIVVVDDGSKDSTAETARKAGAEVYSHIINRGVGAAIITGLKACQRKDADVVVTLDADGQHDVNDIEKIVEPIFSNNADIVIGSRLIRPKGMPFIRKIGNLGLSFLTFLLSGKWVSDSQSGFRAFKKKILPLLTLKGKDFEICSEMILVAKKKKLTIKEISIKVIYTKYSLSKGQSILNGIKTFIRLVKDMFIR